MCVRCWPSGAGRAESRLTRCGHSARVDTPSARAAIGPGDSLSRLARMLDVRAKSRVLLSALAMAATSGCIRRDGRNSDCKWPGETPLRAATPAHLSADAEFAEDLAIRYADTHHGLRTAGYVSGEAYGAARDGCMLALFDRIAIGHGVRAEDVTRALGRNRALVDAAVLLPFGFLYLLGAHRCVRWIWRRYPPGEIGWLSGAIMAMAASFLMASGGTLTGEVWAGLVETYRIGNGHISYRAGRLWWAVHRAEMFAAGWVLFWLLAWLAARSHRGQPHTKLTEWAHNGGGK